MNHDTDTNDSDNNNAQHSRRTALRVLGSAGLALAGLSAPAAAHNTGERREKHGRKRKRNRDRRRQCGGCGKWCRGHKGKRRKRGKGYDRNWNHQDDRTRWDDWDHWDCNRNRDDRGKDESDDSDHSDDEPEPEPDPEEPEDSDSDEDSNDTDDDEDSGDSDDDESDNSDNEPNPEPEPEDPDDLEDGEGSDDTDDDDDDSDNDDSDNEPDPENPASFEQRIEQRIHAEINEYRESEGLSTLEHYDDLRAVARDHSEDMATQDYFSHISSDGEGPGDRLDAAGVDCSGWAENIAWESSTSVSNEDADSIADSTVEGWLNSSGHRRNIRGDYDAEGIGVAVDGQEVYITQVFCAPL